MGFLQNFWSLIPGIHNRCHFCRTYGRLYSRKDRTVHGVVVGAAFINKIALCYDLGLAAGTVALVRVDNDCACTAEITLLDEGIELELLAAFGIWAAHDAHLRVS